MQKAEEQHGCLKVRSSFWLRTNWVGTGNYSVLMLPDLLGSEIGP